MTNASGSFDSQKVSGHAEPPDLRELDGDFDTVNPAENGEVPDGRYQVRLNDVTLDHSQKGDPMLRWDTIVLSGPHAGRHIFKNAVITKASLPFVKGDLKTLGLKLRRFSELPNHLDELVGLALEVTKRTKDEYTNVYFNKRIPAPEVGLPNDNPF